jgi:hypothetical protein
MTAKTKLPLLSKKTIAQIVADLPAKMVEMEKDEDDKRCRQGKYAPETGICRVCGGKVTAEVRFRNDGRLGGPAPGSYINHWGCDDCGLMYQHCPPPALMGQKEK